MTDPTDAAVEALAEELWTVWCGSTLPLEWKNAGISIKDRIRRLGSHVLASRQPKPEDVDHLAWVMQQAEVGWRFNTASAPSTEHAQARAILALYDAPARIPTRSALDSALDPILGNSNARRAVVDAVLGVCGAPTEADDRLATTLFQRNAYKGDRDIANARIVDLEAELAAAKSPTIRPAEGLTEAQDHVARDVISERQRQVSFEGWSSDHDDGHCDGALGRAAACYARHACSSEDDRQINSGFAPADWPWHAFWKPSNRRRDLVKAGALILAEIERLDRAALRASAAPKAEAVDWYQTVKDTSGVWSDKELIAGLCQQVEALRSAAGGSI